MKKLLRHPAARRDLADITDYLNEQAGADVANRFLDDIEAAFAQLLRFPELGRPWHTTNVELPNLRRVLLSDFPVSIFYRPTPSAIEVFRVLHHARHVPPLLEDL